MTIRGVSGQPDPGRVSQNQPKPAEQGQEDAEIIIVTPCQKPDLKNFNKPSDLSGVNLYKHGLYEQFKNMDLKR